MTTLSAHLSRLYLPDGQQLDPTLAQPVPLPGVDGRTRAIVITFDRQPASDASAHWASLCGVANALQTELGMPAPAVSVSGSHGYVLWISLEVPVVVSQAEHFLALLGQVYMAEAPASFRASVAFPPCLDQGTGKWAAYINPGLGASFAEDGGLEMAPPVAGQVALVEGLQRCGELAFARAQEVLEQACARVDQPVAALALPTQPSDEGLLLRDATLEDIVRHLHALGIEPTFRHLIRS